MYKLIVITALLAVVQARPGLITAPAIAAPLAYSAYSPIAYTSNIVAPLTYSAAYTAPAYYKAGISAPYAYGAGYAPLAYI